MRNHNRTVNKYELYITSGILLDDYKKMLKDVVQEIREKEHKEEVFILDPCAGTKSLDIMMPNVHYDLYDISPMTNDIKKADFLEKDDFKQYDLIVCNPPFSLTRKFFEKCKLISKRIIYITSLDKTFSFKKLMFKQEYRKCFPCVTCFVFLGYYDGTDFFSNKLMGKTADYFPALALPKKYLKYIHYNDFDPKHHFVFRTCFNETYKNPLSFDMTSIDSWRIKAASWNSKWKVGDVATWPSLYFYNESDLRDFVEYLTSNYEKVLSYSDGRSISSIYVSRLFLPEDKLNELLPKIKAWG